jgi:hypothetical protein
MVHLHVLTYGEYIPQSVLQNAWSAALGVKAHVHVKAVAGADGVADALRETLKYATKCEKGDRSAPERAAAVELALRDIHRVSIGGALRSVTIADSTGAHEDVRADDLHDDHALTCEHCGVVGEWRWQNIVSPANVAALGGFGIVRADVEELNARRQRQSHPVATAPPCPDNRHTLHPVPTLPTSTA